jgi:hypothetical protein
MMPEQTADNELSRRDFLGVAAAIPASVALDSLLIGQDDKKKQDSLDGILSKKVTAKQKAEFAAMKRLYEAYAKLDSKKKEKEGQRYHAQFTAYARRLLVDEVKLVYDEKKNPDGLVKNCFLLWDPTQRDQAMQKLAGMFGGTKEKYEGTASENNSLSIEYVGPLGRRERAAALLLGTSAFALENADELFSLIDYAFAYARVVESGLNIGGKIIDTNNRHMRLFKQQILLQEAHSIEQASILNGVRKDVTDNFKASVISAYLKCYAYGQEDIATLRRNLAGSGGSADVKEALESYTSFVGQLDSRMKSLGYEHKLVDGKWTLEKAK